MISSTASIPTTNATAALICVLIAAPEATMIATMSRTPSNDGTIRRPITKATHKDSFSHALRARSSSRRIADPPALGSDSGAGHHRCLVGPAAMRSRSVYGSAGLTSTCRRPVPAGAAAHAPRSALPSARRPIARTRPCRSQCSGRRCSWPCPGGQIFRKRSKRWCDMQDHQRNQKGGNTHHQAANPVGEQVLHGSWPGDHEKDDAETHWIDRYQ
jgi:hypothetical protein